jgi:hypothetical protein
MIPERLQQACESISNPITAFVISQLTNTEERRLHKDNET